MAFLMFTGMKMMLTIQLNQKMREMAELSRKRMDLVSLSTAIASGNGFIAGPDLARITPELRQMAYSNNMRCTNYVMGQRAAIMDPATNMPNVAVTGCRTPQDMMAYMRNLDNTAKQSWNRIQEREVNAMELDIEVKTKRIQTEISLIEGRLKAAEEQEGKQIQAAAPKFGTGGGQYG